MASERVRRPHHDWQPRTMTWAEVAQFVFRRSESWLRDHLPETFPRPHSTYDLFATDAVEAWLRQEFNLVSRSGGGKDAEAELLARVRNGYDQGPVSRRSAA